jgi:hypothetical protein
MPGFGNIGLMGTDDPEELGLDYANFIVEYGDSQFALDTALNTGVSDTSFNARWVLEGKIADSDDPEFLLKARRDFADADEGNRPQSVSHVEDKLRTVGDADVLIRALFDIEFGHLGPEDDLVVAISECGTIDQIFYVVDNKDWINSGHFDVLVRNFLEKNPTDGQILRMMRNKHTNYDDTCGGGSGPILSHYLAGTCESLMLLEVAMEIMPWDSRSNSILLFAARQLGYESVEEIENGIWGNYANVFVELGDRESLLEGLESIGNKPGRTTITKKIAESGDADLILDARRKYYGIAKAAAIAYRDDWNGKHRIMNSNALYIHSDENLEGAMLEIDDIDGMLQSFKEFIFFNKETEGALLTTIVRRGSVEQALDALSCEKMHRYLSSGEKAVKFNIGEIVGFILGKDPSAWALWSLMEKNLIDFRGLYEGNDYRLRMIRAIADSDNIAVMKRARGYLHKQGVFHEGDPYEILVNAERRAEADDATL